MRINSYFTEGNIRPKNSGLNSRRYGPALMPIVGIVGGMFASKLMGSGKSDSMPSVTAPERSTTAARVGTSGLSGQEIMNKRLAASLLTQGWGTLTLGKKTLLGA